MNKNYKILGIIISGLNKDYPNKVSKNFTDNVMCKINSKQTSNKISFNKTNLLNIAASIFFAVITSIILLDFNSSENNLVVNEVNEKEAEKHPFKQEIMPTTDAYLEDGTVVDW